MPYNSGYYYGEGNGETSIVTSEVMMANLSQASTAASMDITASVTTLGDPEVEAATATLWQQLIAEEPSQGSADNQSV